jgi:N-acetyl-beta-hexosaminidase
MDEVYYGCWNSSPEVKKFIQDHGMKGVHEFEEYYVTNTLANVKDVGYKYIMWQVF